MTGVVVSAVVAGYGQRTVLHGVSIAFEPGEVCCLIGPNGAGKSTLLSVVAGGHRPSAGSVTVGGRPAGSPAARQLVGLTPQDLAVYPSLTVRQNIAYFGRIGGLRGAALTRRTAELAEATRLGHLLDRRCGELSGGEKRRVHTAMALVHRPRVALLDEPTAGVDGETRDQLLGLVRSLAADGVAVCYTTHYLPEVEALDGQVSVLLGGVLVAAGSVRALAERHGSGGVTLRLAGGAEVRDAALRRLRALPGTVTAGPGPDILHVASAAPEELVGAVVRELGDSARWLRAVEVVRPDFPSAVEVLLRSAPAADEGRVPCASP